MKAKAIGVALSLVLIMSISALADVPDEITYQGRLLLSGAPVTTATSIVFRLYQTLGGGSAVWTETHGSVTPDSEGIYTVILGSTLAIPDGYDALWLELEVAGNTLTPRKKLTSAPFVLRAGTLPGLGVVGQATFGGNLGIGETSPVNLLHIQGSGTSGQVTAAMILENSHSGTLGLDITGSAGISRARWLYGGGPGEGTNSLTEFMTWVLEGSNAGNVGIGTSSPSQYQKLHVGGNLFVAPNSGADNPGLSLRASSVSNVAVIDATKIGTGTIPNMQFQIGGVEKMRLDTSGNLHVFGKATITGGVDPPYISFSDESHESIRTFAKDVDEHEKVMQFWNRAAHRMEVYVIEEDRFYTVTGELVEE